MFLGLSFIGTSFFQSFNNSLPSLKTYDKLIFYAQNSGVTISKVWGRNILISNTTANSYNSSNYNPTFDSNTYMLSLFNNTLFSGNITGLDSPATSWILYRLDSNNNQLIFLAELDVNTTSYEDFRVLMGESYQYYLFAKNSTQLSDPIISDSVSADYWGWYLIDPENNISYQFDSNAQSNPLQLEQDITFYNTNNQYQLVSKGNMNSFTGQIQAIIWDGNGETTYEQGNTIMAQLKEFLLSSRTKYLKDRRSRIWKIETFDYSEGQLNDAISEQVLVSSFSFREIGSVYD